MKKLFITIIVSSLTISGCTQQSPEVKVVKECEEPETKIVITDPKIASGLTKHEIEWLVKIDKDDKTPGVPGVTKPIIGDEEDQIKAGEIIHANHPYYEFVVRNAPEKVGGNGVPVIASDYLAMEPEPLEEPKDVPKKKQKEQLEFGYPKGNQWDFMIFTVAGHPKDHVKFTYYETDLMMGYKGEELREDALGDFRHLWNLTFDIWEKHLGKVPNSPEETEIVAMPELLEYYEIPFDWNDVKTKCIQIPTKEDPRYVFRMYKPSTGEELLTIHLYLGRDGLEWSWV